MWIFLGILLIILVNIGPGLIYFQNRKIYRTRQQEQFIKDARRIMKGKD